MSLGASFTIEVNALGSPQLAYQWRFGEVPIEGATASSLTLANVGLQHAGLYDVVITNDYGSVTSRVAVVTVDPTFTKITGSPVVLNARSSWGGSWVDIDGDHDLDLVTWNGADSSPAQRNAAYRNDGAGTFVELTTLEVGDIVAVAGQWGAGVWGDLDNDGDVDCVATDWNGFPGLPMRLFRNEGQGLFNDWGITDPLTTDLAAGYGALADYDNDGLLDVFVGCAWSAAGVAQNRLYRGLGEGRFERVNEGPVATDPYVGTEGQAWADYDNDGDLDLVVTDTHAWFASSGAYPVRLYRNEGFGTFSRIMTGAIAEARGAALVPAWADCNNDGLLDLFLGNYGGDSWLFINQGNGEFTTQIYPTGRASAYPAWGDYDNDGDLDLMVATGQGNAQVDILFRNEGGQLIPQEIGSPTSELGRAGPILWGDYDNDGFLDLFVGHTYNETNSLFQNNGNGNHWILIDLKGTTSNRSAIGAKVRVETGSGQPTTWQMREISGGNRNQGDPRAHFGLGDATIVDTLRIEWPSGIVQELKGVAPNQILTVTEPPRLTPQAAGGFQIQCWINQSFEVECSTDLETWTSSLTVTNTTGTLVFSDPEADQHTCRYYRVVAK